MKKFNLTPFLAVLLICAAFFIIYSETGDRSSLKELNKANAELRHTLDRYQVYTDSINNVILTLEDSIKVLANKKPEIKIKYETKIKDYSNPFIVSNDSVTRYIASKIHSK